MTSRYRELSERLRGEVRDLENLVHRVVKAWERVQSGGDPEGMCLDSVALNLHGFYSGLESLFGQIARHEDGVMPDGADWHKSLLQQVTSEREDSIRGRKNTVRQRTGLTLAEKVSVVLDSTWI